MDCIQSLKFDEACVRLIGDSDRTDQWLYSLSSDCESCPYQRIVPVLREPANYTFNTVWPVTWRVLANDGSDAYVSAENTSEVLCTLTPELGQYGFYEFRIAGEECSLETLVDPVYPYTELFTVLGSLALILLAFSGARLIWSKLRNVSANQDRSPPAKQRVRAIDTFRGASTVLMIFVNDGSGGYPILGHATWNGLLPGDLVFPCFMWIMGVCIPMALASQGKRGISKLEITRSVLRRSLTLFLIGVALNSLGTDAQLERLRLFGVLQRFGIAYLIGALSFLYLTPKDPGNFQTTILRELRDVMFLGYLWLLALVYVVVHCAFTFGLSVPGCPMGYLGPGGRHENGKFWECTGGSAGYVDRMVLGITHIYQWPLIREVYGSGPFDPEGILGCFTTVIQVFMGIQTGVTLMTFKCWKARTIRWLSWAAIFGAIGCALHFGDVIPINKSLWSLSFVLVSTSFALLFLTFCYILVDVAKIWNGGPFRIPGMNALTLYVGHMMCYQIVPFHWKIGSMNCRWLTFVESVWGTILWIAIAYLMHSNRTYITL